MLKLLDLLGSPGRTRTSDRVVNSHLLYRLSYRGIIRYSFSDSLLQAGINTIYSLFCQ